MSMNLASDLRGSIEIVIYAETKEKVQATRLNISSMIVLVAYRVKAKMPGTSATRFAFRSGHRPVLASALRRS